MRRSPAWRMVLWVALLSPGCFADAHLPPTPPVTATATDPMPSPPRHGTPSPSPAPTPTPPPALPSVRIAAGATASYTDPSGNVWAADVDFTGGTTTVSAMPVAIAGTDSAVLYNAERYGQAGQAAGGFSYAVPVPNGAYVVRLGFAETYLTAAGQRLFDVSIGGQKVLTAFDIFAAAGAMNSAVVQSFPITVTSGQVEIAFAAGTIQNPKVNTIEIVPAASSSDGGVGP